MDLFRALEWYTRKQHSIYSCGEQYETLDWHVDNELPKPTKTQLNTAWEEYLADFEKREYQRKRQAEYPPIAAQLDVMYNQGFNGWLKHIHSIKKKHPAPHKSVEPNLGDPLAEIKARMTDIETKNVAQIQSAKQELADLQAAVIDIKGAIYAIKGFMMEIPNIQKALTELSDVVKSK